MPRSLGVGLEVVSSTLVSLAPATVIANVRSVKTLRI